MTEINTVALMRAIDEADKIVAEKQRARKDIELDLRQSLHDEAVATAYAEGLHRSLLLVTPQHDKGSQPSPAPERDRPAGEKPPLEQCIAAIRNTFMMPLNPGVSDRMAQEQLAKAGHKFRLPTVRNALAEIGKELRASEVPASETNSPSSPPVDAPGAETESSGDFPDIPENLRRAPSGQPRAVE
jgi:hypothetical protein